MTSRPKALIVDFGGVLTTSVFESFSAFCETHGITRQAFDRALALETHPASEQSPLHQVEIGAITLEDFSTRVATSLSADLASPLESEGLRDRLFSQLRPEPTMVIAVKMIKDAGFKTGLLSNSWGEGGYPADTLSDLFDEVVLSGEVGLRKPQPAIYELMLERLGVPASQAVFVDDLRINVEGAEAVGMIGIRHRNPQDTLSELARLFEVPVGAF